MRWATGDDRGLALALLPASALAQDSSSSFTQLTGRAGCVAQEPPLPFDERAARGVRAGARAAERVRGRRQPRRQARLRRVVAAPTRLGSNGVVAFSRAGDTGALTSVGCVSDSGGDGRPGTDGFCANGDALLGASDIAVSPDGRHVYVASHTSNGIAWLARDAATGTLTPAGCIKELPARRSLPRAASGSRAPRASR